MFGYGKISFLWILILTEVTARHVPLASQRNSAQSRPRLLVIRPPEGSGQPNRIVLLANQRPPPQPTNASPSISTALSVLQETAAVAQANLNRAFGGHPQSAFRQQSSSSGSSSSSSSSSSSGTRSLRNLLQGMRRSGPATSSNIARVSDTIPRAMPPVLPPTKRFGELNIPSVIEAALRRLQERARLQGNVRDNNVLPRHDFRITPSPSAPSTPDRSPFSGGVIDLSRLSLNERNNRNEATTTRNSGSRSNSNTPRWDIGTLLSSSTLGRNGVSPREKNQLNRNSNGVRQTQNGNGPFVKNNDLLQMPTDSRSFPPSSAGRTGSNLRTFQDKTLDKTAVQTNADQPNLDIQTLMADPWTPPNSLTSTQNNNGSPGQSSTFDSQGSNSVLNNVEQNLPQYPGQFPPRNFDVPIPAPSRINDFQAIPRPPPVNTTQQFNPQPKNTTVPAAAAAAVSLNATAKVSASSAEANSTSNQTSTKSVKTKTIKVTTVVKSSPKADVNAAAANQAAANIANAVAKGKPMTNRAKASAGASGKKRYPSTNPDAGSITVRRQPNGDSIITLSDGYGEPVVLRASGPVRIERIVKPNGRIQFLINPVQAKQTTANPLLDGEIEPEDITTTESPTQSNIGISGFTDAIWTTNAPFYTDPIMNKDSAASPVSINVPANSPEPGTTKIEKTIQIKETAVADTASASVNTSVKNETANASVKADGLMKLFKPPNIPRPPKVSDMNVGNAGLLNQFIANTQKYMSNQQTKTIPIQSDLSLKSKKFASTTYRPAILSDRRIQSLNIFQKSANGSPAKNLNSDVMPQYNLLGVSPPSLTFVPQGQRIP